jgi:hypothetical protein
MKQDWVMCCSFGFLSVFGLKSIFQQSHPFLPIKQGLSDVLPLWFLSLCLVLRVFFNSPAILPIKQDWGCAALCDFLSCVWS